MDFPADLDHLTPDPQQPLLGDGEGEPSPPELEKLRMLGASLAARRDEWVQARATQGLDQRWVEDVDQYNGKDQSNRATANMMASVEQGFPVTTKGARPTRSTVFVQVTRQKTNAAIARLGDILLPTEERNFSIQPTPLPRMPAWVQPTPVAAVAQARAIAGMGGAPGGATGAQNAPGSSLGSMQGVPQGPQQAAPAASGGPQPAMAPGMPMRPPQPMQAPDPMAVLQRRLTAEQAEAKRRCDAMQEEISDALNQCDYNAECRRMIFDAGVMGTGVLKGPVVTSTVRKAWRRSTDLTGHELWALEVMEELSPASFRVDPRNCYPDPACGDSIQHGRGHFECDPLTRKQVRELLRQPAYMREQVREVLEEGPQQSKAQRRVADIENRDVAQEDQYERWIYWGEIEPEELEACGVELSEDEKLAPVSACVEIINSTVVRAFLNPLPDGELPYDYFAWERVPGSVWGYGIPYLMRSQQRVINAAWRMILDNAAVSAGPQIVVKPGLVTPADQQWNLTARKVWYATDDVEDVSKAFAMFEFKSYQQELQAIIEMAERLSDAETAVPQLAQGERGSAPETVGGMQMLMQSSNVVLKRLVKQYDDDITKPHIRRYYDYLMEYSDKDEIKGDFSVVALGSSSLVVRDIQNQAVTQMLQLASNPVYAPLINAKKLFERALKAQHIDPTDVMNTDAEIDAAQRAAREHPQQDPRVAAAQMRSQADMQRTQAQLAMSQNELQAKTGIAAAQRQMTLEQLAMQRDIELLRLSQQQNMSIEQIKAQLAAVAIRERAASERHAASIQLDSAKAATQRVDNERQTAISTLSAAQEANEQRLHERLMTDSERLHNGFEAQSQARAAREQRQHDAAQAEAQRRHETQQAAEQRKHDAARAKQQAAARAKTAKTTTR